LTAERAPGRDPILSALGAVLEGVTFYDLAQLAVADTRVKATFEEFGRQKRSQLARLEALAGPTARDAATGAGLYPTEVVARVECYVCGFGVETKAMPATCPKCGAARYSFEKEIAQAKAWEIAGAASRKTASLFRDVARGREGPVRSLLEELIVEEDGIAQNADRHAAELRT